MIEILFKVISRDKVVASLSNKAFTKHKENYLNFPVYYASHSLLVNDPDEVEPPENHSLTLSEKERYEIKKLLKTDKKIDNLYFSDDFLRLYSPENDSIMLVSLYQQGEKRHEMYLSFECSRENFILLLDNNFKEMKKTKVVKKKTSIKEKTYSEILESF